MHNHIYLYKVTCPECGTIRHMPEGSYENTAIIKIKDFKPEIEYINNG